jgi:hypothetical protein
MLCHLLIVSSVSQLTCCMVAECIWGLRRSDNVSCSLVPYHDEGTHRVTQPLLHLRAMVSCTFSYSSLVSLCCASQFSRLCAWFDWVLWSHAGARLSGGRGGGVCVLPKGGKMNIWNKKIFCAQQFYINPLKTKRRLLYLKTQSVPRCKWHTSLFVLR